MIDGRDGAGEGAVGVRRLVVVAIAVEAGLGVLALGGKALFGRWEERWVNWDLGGVGWGLLGAGILSILLLLIRRFPVGSLGRLMEFVEEVLKPLFLQLTILDLFMISVLAGVGEELLFRGLLQGGLAQWWTPLLGSQAALATALVVTSVLFGLAHCVTREYFVFASVLGLLLGLLVVVSGGLLAPIVAHAGYDFVALLVVTRGRSGRQRPPSEAAGER